MKAICGPRVRGGEWRRLEQIALGLMQPIVAALEERGDAYAAADAARREAR
jgi:hypothetical protein